MSVFRFLITKISDFTVIFFIFAFSYLSHLALRCPSLRTQTHPLNYDHVIKNPNPNSHSILYPSMNFTTLASSPPGHKPLVNILNIPHPFSFQPPFYFPLLHLLRLLRLCFLPARNPRHLLLAYRVIALPPSYRFSARSRQYPGVVCLQQTLLFEITLQPA